MHALHYEKYGADCGIVREPFFSANINEKKQFRPLLFENTIDC